MKFEQVCQTALLYFQQHSVLKIFLPISTPLMLLCVVLRLVQNVISLGSLVSTLTFFVFFLMLILTLAQCNLRMAALGLAGFTLDYLLSFLMSLVRYHMLAYGSLLYVVVFGGLAFLSYQKSMTFNR